MSLSVSLMFRASRFCIRASQIGEALARWAGGSKALMLSPDVHQYVWKCNNDIFFRFAPAVTQDLEERARLMKMKMTAYRQAGSSPGASHGSDSEALYSARLRDHATSSGDRYHRDRGRGIERGYDRGRELDRGHHRSRRRGRTGVYAGAVCSHLFRTCLQHQL